MQIIFRPPTPPIPRGDPMPPNSEENRIESPPTLGDLGGFIGFVQEV